MGTRRSRAFALRSWEQGRDDDDLDGSVAASLFDRQIDVAARMTGTANTAHALAVAFIGIVVLPVPPVARAAWTVTGVALCLATVIRWSPPDPARYRAVFREMLGASVLFGLLWTVAVTATFTAGDADQRILLGCLIAGVIGAGAISLSTSPTLALTWTLCIAAGPLLVYLWLDEAALQQLSVLLVVYVLAMTVGILFLAGNFKALHHAEREAAEGRLDLQVLLDDVEADSRDWLWETDSAQVLSRLPERISVLAGSTRPGLTLPDLLVAVGATADPDGLAARRSITAAFDDGAAFSDLVVPVLVEGERRWWSLSGKPYPDGQWRGLGSDLTEEMTDRLRIHRLITTDTVTGLPNRHAFDQELTARLRHAGQHRTLHLGIVDIDHFKMVNDTLGHPVGDVLITQVAATLATDLTDGEFCARLGGDEFVVLLEAGIPESTARRRFEEIHAAINAGSYAVPGQLLTVTSSIGVANSHSAGPDSATLISSADLALYAAKGAGRDLVRFWTPALTETATRRRHLVHELSQAVGDGRFETHWQPQTDLRTGAVLGHEALLRWHHPERGLLGPAHFRQVAVESGLIVEIGRAVLRDVFRAAADRPTDQRVAVNVSARELRSPGYVAHVISAAQQWSVLPSRITLEVTEDVIVGDDSRQSLLALRAAGFGISMDDFGTGYSSLALLADIRFDEIKIDPSFVRPLTDADPTFRTLVRTIIDMGSALGARVVAVGVETAPQRELLLSMGCHIVQGAVQG